MRTLKDISHSASMPSRLALTLKRLVRKVPSLAGELGTSAFSLAMLVFLVQEARATALAQDASLAAQPMDTSDLDAVRQVFGDSAADQVAGIDYTAIADAVAQIADLYAQEALVDEGVDLLAEGAMGQTDAAVQGMDAELGRVDLLLKDAVQYAQLSPEVLPAATSPVVAEESDDRGGILPFLFFGAGVALAGSGSSGSTTAPVEYYKSAGYAADGYISGATVFQDLNGNGKWDAGEPKGVTDANGKFSIDLVKSSTATLIVTGGTDTSTGLTFTGVLKAPPGSSIVTPMTTMVQALIESTGLTLEQAKAVVVKAYSIDASIDLLNFDPFSAANQSNPATFALQKANIFLASVMTTGAALLSSAGGLTAEQASLKMASALSDLINGRFVPAADGYGYGEYGDAASIKALLLAAADGFSDSALAKLNAASDDVSIAIANTTRDLAAAPNLTALVTLQVEAQKTLTDAITAAVSGGSTSGLTDAVHHDISGATPLTLATGTTLNLLSGASDPDNSHTLRVTDVTYQVGSGQASITVPAGLSLSSAGVLTIDPTNAALRALALGQTEVVTVTYTVTDGYGNSATRTATITFTGTNDAPTVAAALTSAAYEADASYTLNLLSGASDVDTTDTLSVSAVTYQVGQGQASSTVPTGLSLSSAGVLTVDPTSSAFNYLAANQTLAIVVSYTISDGNGGTVAQTATITITGTNDAPTVAAALTQSATEASNSVTLDLLAGASDVDAGETATLALSGVTYTVGNASASSTLPAGLTLSSAGVLTVDPTNAAFNHLAAGVTETITVSYDVVDAQGATVTQTATITITGAAQTAEISLTTAQSLYSASTLYSADDTVTLALTADQFSTLSATDLTHLGSSGLGVDIVSITSDSGLHLQSAFFTGGDASLAHAIDASGMHFATGTTVTMDVALASGSYDGNGVDSGNGSYLTSNLSDSSHAATGGLSLASLGLSGLGVDVIDIVGNDGTHGDYTAHINGADVLAVNDASMKFAASDTIKLDLTSDQFSTADASKVISSLSLQNLGDLGVDQVTVAAASSSVSDLVLHIDPLSTTAADPTHHTVTMDVALETGSYDDNGNGSHLATSLSDSSHAATGGLSLASLGLNGLGVDVIDIVGHGGLAGDYTAHINGADILAVNGASMTFAASDTIKLDLASDQFSSTSASTAFDGLSLQNLGALGVDQVTVAAANSDVSGLVLHIDPLSATATDPTHHTVTMDVALASGSYDTHGNGSHLATSLSDGTHAATDGLSLTQLHGLGVDVIDVVSHDGTQGNFSLHIDAADAVDVSTAEMVFAADDTIVLDVASASDLTSMSDFLASGSGLESLHVDGLQLGSSGVEVLLGGDQSLVDLLRALTGSGVLDATDVAAAVGDLTDVSGVVVGSSADITITDAMVKALLDNGMFTADTASVIQVDATADTDGHVGITLAQLGEIGADQVVVSQAKAYVNLGNVTDADALGTLVDSLAAGESQSSLVTNTQGDAVTTALVLDSQTQATIVTLLDGSSDAATTLIDKLATIGIAHVYVADSAGTELIGLDHYRDLLATG